MRPSIQHITTAYSKRKIKKKKKRPRKQMVHCFSAVVFIYLGYICLMCFSILKDAGMAADLSTTGSVLPTLPTTKTSPNDAASTGSIVAAPPQTEAPPPRTTKDEHSLPRVLAIIFPQYHRDPLNDKFWGEGFTDWDSLRKAPAKNRLGYAIPRPTELGYYDLTDVAPRRAQGELAQTYGIDGFIFHHYWFYDETHPGPSLHAPLEQMLLDGHPNTPFCLHWCATKWQNTWHGDTAPGYVMPENGVLQNQYFPEEDDTDGAVVEHYNWLRRFFHHPNYIKVNGGMPLFMLYNKKPRSVNVVKKLRELAKADGFPGLYVTLGLTKPHRHLQTIVNPKKNSFQLSRRARLDVFDKTVAYPNPSEWNTKIPMTVPQWCQQQSSSSTNSTNTSSRRRVKRNREISGILTSFDNTPRRSYKDATLWSADEPDAVVGRFEQSMEAALYYETCCFIEEDKTNEMDDAQFIVINSMNEWAEGMALEPSDVFGRRFLETILRTKQDLAVRGCSR